MQRPLLVDRPWVFRIHPVQATGGTRLRCQCPAQRRQGHQSFPRFPDIAAEVQHLLLNHAICEGEKRLREFDVEGLGSLEVNGHVKFRGLLDR
jgi:hypothetical protein